MGGAKGTTINAAADKILGASSFGMELLLKVDLWEVALARDRLGCQRQHQVRHQALLGLCLAPPKWEGDGVEWVRPAG